MERRGSRDSGGREGRADGGGHYVFSQGTTLTMRCLSHFILLLLGRPAANARLSNLVSGLGAILDECWDLIGGGSMGSTLWRYSCQHAAVVADGLVAAGRWLVWWDPLGPVATAFLEIGCRHLNRVCK